MFENKNVRMVGTAHYNSEIVYKYECRYTEMLKEQLNNWAVPVVQRLSAIPMHETCSL